MEEKTKFPVIPLIGCIAYGIASEYFKFGDRDWFAHIRPDILIAHPLYGYFLASFGRYISERVEKLKGKGDLTSRIAGGAGIVMKELVDMARYATGNVFDPADMLGGSFGVLIENYLSLRKRDNSK